MTEFISRKYGNEGYEIIIKTDSHEHYRASEDFARRLIDHAKPVTDNNVGCNWIPVAERLPEDDLPKGSKVKRIKVLVAYRTNGNWIVRTQIRAKGYWYSEPDKWDWIKERDPITHWMPLPEPPKGEK